MPDGKAPSKEGRPRHWKKSPEVHISRFFEVLIGKGARVPRKEGAFSVVQWKKPER
jgi:hypothetical protein